jgi:hypothetical protein
VPDGFAREVYLMLAPGATMPLTGAPILTENNTTTDLTVLSDGPPEA